MIQRENNPLARNHMFCRRSESVRIFTQFSQGKRNAKKIAEKESATSPTVTVEGHHRHQFKTLPLTPPGLPSLIPSRQSPLVVSIPVPVSQSDTLISAASSMLHAECCCKSEASKDNRELSDQETKDVYVICHLIGAFTYARRFPEYGTQIVIG